MTTTGRPMAEPAGATDQNPGEDLKRQLVQRAAIAGVLAAALLGGLAIFDRMDDSDEPSTQRVVSAAKPEGAGDRMAPPPAVAQADSSDSAASEPPSAMAPPVADVALPTAPAVPPSDPVPSVAVPATAAETLAAKPPAQTVRILAEREPQAAVGGSSATAGGAKEAKPIQPVPESTGAPDTPPPPEVAAVPTEAVPEETGGAVHRSDRRIASSSSTRISHGYLVQAGVFNSPRRAEELHERLRQAGVESRLETRVQVGPFRSRQEAEAARERLKALGVESLLVSPRGLGGQ